MIATDDVRRAITQAIGPALQARGFRSFRAGRSLRDGPGHVDVVEVQFCRSGFMPSNCPSLAIGRWLDFVPEDPVAGPLPRDGTGRPRMDEAICQIRKSVYRHRTRWWRKRQGLWMIGDDQSGLQGCVADLVAAVDREVLPWFDRLDDPAALFELVATGRSDIEGRLADPVMRGTWGFDGAFKRQVVAGFLAARCGRPEIAARLLGEVLREGGWRLPDGELRPLQPALLAQVRAEMPAI